MIEINDNYQIKLSKAIEEAEKHYVNVLSSELDKLDYLNMMYVTSYLSDRLFASYRMERLLNHLKHHKK